MCLHEYFHILHIHNLFTYFFQDHIKIRRNMIPILIKEITTRRH